MLESITPSGPSESRNCERHGAFTSRYVRGRGIWTTCPQCQRVEIDREAREQVKALDGVRRLAIVTAAKIPEKYAAAELSGEHANELKAWLCRSEASQASLVMLGPTGTGKTHLACALLRLASSQGIRCRYTTSAGFLTRLSAAWDGDGHERQVFAEFTEPKLLVLDDVGANSGSEALRIKLGQLIDERSLHARSTVVLTNLTALQLQTELGDRAYSRLLENLTQIIVKGRDRRRG